MQFRRTNREKFYRIGWMLLFLALLAGCSKAVEPTQPVTTTQEPTTVQTEPETTAFIPLPLELDVPADEVLFASEQTFTISGYIDPEYTVTVCGQKVTPIPTANLLMKPL